MRLNYGMKRADISAYNPQSNGIIERVHLVMGDHIRVMELQNEEVDKTKPFHSMLHTVAYAIRSTYHTTLHASPAQLVYGRDMFLPIKFKADWKAIRERRQEEIRRNNINENKSRKEYVYKIGDQVLLTNSRKNPAKLDPPQSGPYLVEHVYANGTIRIQRGAISECVNIR